MPIIVTGAAGFVGRSLIRHLVERGDGVVAIDNHAAGMVDGSRKVVGDIGSADVREEAFRDGCSALIHLATIPGGAAEADPILSRRVNIDATYDLLEAAKKTGHRPRVIFASSIAVFGDLPADIMVYDSTVVAPKMIYGGHKAMMEIAISMMHRRGEIDALSLRLPGIVARPKGPSGMKSAFMSELFHALRAGQNFLCPVSETATIWVQSVDCCARNLAHALDMERGGIPSAPVLTLPAQRVAMAALVSEIATQCCVSPSLVSFQADATLQAAFGAQPPLATPAADACGFAHDGNLATLVSNALAALE